MVPPPTSRRSILRHLDVHVVDEASRREAKQRQHHLPPITTFRWWARRTEAVTGAIIDAAEQDLPGPLLIADPFAGGGVIVLSAVLRRHKVYAQDVNPWAAQSLVSMLSLAGPGEIDAAGTALESSLKDTLTEAYGTAFADGTPATVAHTLRVAVGTCPSCHVQIHLFPTALVSLTERVDTGGSTGWVACPAGHLQKGSATEFKRCAMCQRRIDPSASYTRGRRARCWNCGAESPISKMLPLRWKVALVERTTPERREIDMPTQSELSAAEDSRWSSPLDLGPITVGEETSVLLRHGFARWQDLYPRRQLAVLEALIAAVPASGSERVQRVLRSAILGSTEMAGLCSRWDARYLKSYETVANHRYNFTTLAAEPNVWGAPRSGRGTVNRRLAHIEKAAVWYHERLGRLPTVVGPLEATADRRHQRRSIPGDAVVVVGSSVRLNLADGSVSLVCTDPPYHDDVSYSELSELFRTWAGMEAGALVGDAIVDTLDATDNRYQQTLTDAFREMKRVLRSDGHLVLSYANRTPRAWIALFTALQDAGFRAVGYQVVSAENELDHAKTGRRSCNLDVLLDLVPDSTARARRFQPQLDTTTDERQYCHLVGRWALRIGNLKAGWSKTFVAELSASPFLTVTSAR